MNCYAKINAYVTVNGWLVYKRADEFSMNDECGDSFKTFYRVVLHKAKDMQHSLSDSVNVFLSGDGVDVGILIDKNFIIINNHISGKNLFYRRGFYA